MIDFDGKGFMARLRKVKDDEFGKIINDFLIDGEYVVGAYKSVRDGVVFTVTSSYTLCGFGAAKKVSEGVYFIHTSFYYTFIKKAERAGREIVKVY